MQRKLAVLLAALFAVLMAPLTARAADCDTRVVDGYGAFNAAGSGQVDAAARNLAAQGAEVRVRTVRDFGGSANLDQYEASLLSYCASWQGTNGKMKNNMVVLMLSLGSKRGVGLYYGNQWKPTLDAKWPGILASKVKPKAAANVGDYAGALTDGLDQVTVEVAAQAVAPTSPRPTPVQPAPQQPAPPPVIVHQPPGPDHAVLWAGVLVGLLAAGALIWLFLNRKSRRDAERAAQQKAKVAKNGCSSKINEMQEDVDLLPARVNKLAGVMSEEDVAPLREAADGIKRDYGNASSRYADLSSSATDPDKDGLSVGEYAQIAGGFNGVLTDLEGVRQSKEAFETKASALERTIGQAPTQIKDAEAAIAAATTDIGEVEKTGFKVEGAKAVLGEAESFLGQARTALTGKCFGQVAGATAKAQDKAKAASKAAKALVQTKADADASIVRLKDRVEAGAASLSSAKETFTQMSAAYAETCWADLRTTSIYAESAVAEARNFLAAATDGASMEKQNFGVSATAVKNGNDALDRIDKAMGDIRGRKRDLDAAKAEAPGKLDQADTAIAAARKYVREHAIDVGTSVDGDLSSAATAVKDARTAFTAKALDCLAVVASAGYAKKKAEAAFVSATKKFEAAEALRRRAATAVVEASEAIGAAAGYVREHGSDVDLDPAVALQDARSALNRAQSASTLASRIDLADAAKVTAVAVHATAQGRVRAANARRAEAARLAAEAEAQRLQQQRDAEAAAALLTGAVLGAALSNSERSERHSRRDDDDDGSRFGGGSVSLDDDPSSGGSSGNNGGSVSLDVYPSNDGSVNNGGSDDI